MEQNVAIGVILGPRFSCFAYLEPSITITLLYKTLISHLGPEFPTERVIPGINLHLLSHPRSPALYDAVYAIVSGNFEIPTFLLGCWGNRQAAGLNVYPNYENARADVSKIAAFPTVIRHPGTDNTVTFFYRSPYVPGTAPEAFIVALPIFSTDTIEPNIS